MRINRLSFVGPLALAAAMLAPRDAQAIPAWARKYNMNCSGCHSPAVPRLNAKGFAFKWAGYRMPEEIGENQEVKQISEYLAARFNFQYVWAKTESQSADANSLALGQAAIFAGGPIGKNYGGFLELAHSSEGVEVVSNLYGVWGKEKEYGGVRVGQFHWLFEGGVAGFDRATGLNGPTPLENPLTTAAPFAFGARQVGGEVFYVKDKNRLSFEVFNGVNAAGMGDGAGSPDRKDFAAIDQLIYDANGSGLMAVAYFGTVDGLDTALTKTSHFNRFALSANKIVNGFEVMGGYAYAKDNDLPVGAMFTTRSVTGNGFWGYAGYTFPSSSLTTFGRYEYINSNKDIANSGNARYVLGGVLPVSLPEYLRLAAEYTLDKPRETSGLKRHGLTLEVALAF